MIGKIEFDRVRDHRDRRVRPVGILEQIKYAEQEGGNILYIHAMEQPEIFVVESPLPEKDGDRSWRYSEIEWAKDHMIDRVDLEQLPGIDEVYFMYVR